MDFIKKRVKKSFMYGCVNPAYLTILCTLALCLSTAAFAFQIEVSESPANNRALTLKAIQSAQSTLKINIYEFTESEIAQAVVDRIRAGVQVEVLLETQPVGGMSKDAREVERLILEAMKESSADHHFYQMTSKLNGQRRFRFDHAKYTIVDDQAVLIGSENYTAHSQPHFGTVGNRGWEVIIYDSETVRRFKELFAKDTGLEHGDILDLMDSENLEENLKSNSMKEERGPLRFNTTPAPSGRDIIRMEAKSLKTILSPDNSLNQLTSLMKQARSQIDLELMTFDSEWGEDTYESPLMSSVLDAARRGVEVRILLNDENVFHPRKRTKTRNQITAESFNEKASREGLKLSARIADVNAMKVTYIHNKGALIDGNQTLISSINWNKNSVMNNREAAVVLNSTALFDHYENVFATDWEVSEFTLRNLPFIESYLLQPSASLMAELENVWAF
jgi:cardiolipin synthase A/B